MNIRFCHARISMNGVRAFSTRNPDSRSRDPAGVKTPSGPFTDILHAWHGDLAYNPALVQAPVAIVRGEWDGLIDEDARWLFDAFTASPIKRDIKSSRATHLMHLETMRYALYRESIAFLMADDELSVARPGANRCQPRAQPRGGQFMNAQQEQKNIPGYDYGTAKVARSPVTLDEWETLKKSALFSEEDAVYLRLSHDVLADQVDDLLDT
jgi:hypothetical protein